MIDLLIILLIPALKAVDGGSRNPLHWLCALVAGIVDVVIAHTTWAFVAGWPRKGEWTVSHTLERLCHYTNSAHPDYFLWCEIGYKINRATRSHHIKVLTE